MKRYHYTHAGKTFGPITAVELRQLAVKSQLHPTDRVWEEGKIPAAAVAAASLVDFATLSEVPVAAPVAPTVPLAAPVAPAARAALPARAAPVAAAPDWLADVARAEEPAARGPVAPDWIQSLTQASEAAGPSLATDVEWLPPMLPASVGPCRISVGSATSCGLARLRNEDHFLTQQLCWSSGEDVHEATLLVVADGMGGEKAGDRASELVISTLAAVLGPVLAGLLRGRSQDAGTAPLTQALGQALREAHLTVSQVADGDAACRGMGSTAAVVVIRDGRAVIGHVGDCRVYHQRGEGLTQVTRDHTLVARMVEMGQLTPEEAVNHPTSNQVTQALGKKGPLQPSQHELELQRGDWLIVACDGLAAHVDADEVCQTARQAVPSAAYLAKRLVELANEGGGTDNCTVVAAYCY